MDTNIHNPKKIYFQNLILNHKDNEVNDNNFNNRFIGNY